MILGIFSHPVAHSNEYENSLFTTALPQRQITTMFAMRRTPAIEPRAMTVPSALSVEGALAEMGTGVGEFVGVDTEGNAVGKREGDAVGAVGESVGNTVGL